MDSKLVSKGKSNLEVASNIWAKLDGQDASPWEALEYVPGDLRVQLQGGSEDKRFIERSLLATSRAFRSLKIPDLIAANLKLKKRQRGCSEAPVKWPKSACPSVCSKSEPHG